MIIICGVWVSVSEVTAGAVGLSGWRGRGVSIPAGLRY